MTGGKAVVLRGLHPQPLASYFGAIGVLRLVSEQLVPTVRGCFGANGFELRGIAEDELIDFLLKDYIPTPVVSPWNGGSGFSEGDNTEALDAICETTSERFSGLRKTISETMRWPELPPRGLTLREVTERANALPAAVRSKLAPELQILLATDPILREAPISGLEADEGRAARKVFTAIKAQHRATVKGDVFLRARAELSDAACGWLDAAVVLTADGPSFVDLFGSGGNEGRQDYSRTYLASLQSTLIQGDGRVDLLRALLFDLTCVGLDGEASGQFTPGAAGGANMRPDASEAGVPTNPWSFVLLVEGLVAWTSSASKRGGTESSSSVSPFTVSPVRAGHGSVSRQESLRREVWTPVWTRPLAYQELVYLLREGRADLNGKAARNAIEIVEAIRSLGVDRGVSAFIRYVFAERRGQGYYVAVPTTTVTVDGARHPEVDLLRQLDRELDILDRLLSGFPSEQGPPALLVGLRRSIDEARFDVALRGGPHAMTRLVQAIGAMEMTLARRDPGKDPKLPRPLGRLGSDWVAACSDTAEVRIAAALASITVSGGAGPLRAYLAPLDDESVRYAPAQCASAWVGADVPDRLASILQRRFLDVRARSSDVRRFESNPTWGARLASLEDIATFLAPELVDDRALEELLFGFTWCAHSASTTRGAGGCPPLPRSYALLRLLFLPHGIRRGEDRVRICPDPAVVSLLRAGRIDDAVAVARRQLVAAGFRPRKVTVQGYSDATFGRRLAAALLVPVGQTSSLVQLALIPEDTGDTRQSENDNNQEMNDAR